MHRRRLIFDPSSPADCDPPLPPHPSFSPSPPVSFFLFLSLRPFGAVLFVKQNAHLHTRWLSAVVCACISGTARSGQAWSASLALSNRSGGPGDAREKSTVRKRIITRVTRMSITMLPSTCTVSAPASWLGREEKKGA